MTLDRTRISVRSYYTYSANEIFWNVRIRDMIFCSIQMYQDDIHNIQIYSKKLWINIEEKSILHEILVISL